MQFYNEKIVFLNRYFTFRVIFLVFAFYIENLKKRNFLENCIHRHGNCWCLGILSVGI